ncbi:MAG: hypothetical protein ACKVOR_00995 [Flavobacteriales bacterium]
MRNRKATVERNGSKYRDKQECLDYLEHLRKHKMPLHGIEIVHLMRDSADSNLYKTVWYATQDGVYDLASAFIKEQMVGVWNYAELKL